MADELWSFYSDEVDTSVKVNTFSIRLLIVLQDYLVSIQNKAIMVLYMQPVQWPAPRSEDHRGDGVSHKQRHSYHTQLSPNANDGNKKINKYSPTICSILKNVQNRLRRKTAFANLSVAIFF